MKLKNTFSTRLFITNTCILIISTIAILFYFYHFMVNKEVDYAEHTLQTLHTKTCEQVDELVNRLDKTALQIASTPYTYRQFSQLLPIPYINLFNYDHFLRSEMRDFLIPFILKDQSVTRICLYNKTGDFIDIGYKSTTTTSVNEFFKSNTYHSIVDYFDKGSEQPLFMPPQQDPFTSPSPYLDQIQVLSVIRPIKNYIAKESSVLGFVEVQIDYSVLENIFSSLEDDTISYILDKEGRVIYPLSDKLQTFFASDIDSHNYIYTISSLSTIDYDLVLLKNKESLVGQYRQLQNKIVFIFFITFLLICALQGVIFSYFMRPLKKLQQSVEQINIDNLSLQLLADESSDEFTQLNSAFTTMFDQLRKSIDNTILAKTSLTRAHFLALQAQIDPHFIHNVLAVMATIAEEHDVPKIEEMCTKLANMLRFSTSYKATTVPLKEEFAYTEAYLDLMKDRYEDMFSYTLHLDPETQDLEIPKLILQPLAENCFHHGFKQKPSPWYIKIDSCVDLENNSWLLTVEDNGVGFSEAFIEDFIKQQETIQWQTTDEELKKLEIGGLCLSNLFLRLKLFYKEDAIFTVSNNSLGGATICIGGVIHDSENINCRR